MGIEFIFLGIALVCVALTRGSYKQLLTTRFSHIWTLAVAVVGQLVLAFAPIPQSQYDSTGLAILLATYVLLFGFCVANLNVKGMWVVLTGIACNAVVIGLNKGMPVTNSGDYVVQESIKHQQSTSADLLPWLGDIFPINALSIAISVGDIILGIGLVYVCFFASRKPHVESEEIVGSTEMINTDFEMTDVDEISEVAPSRSSYEKDLDVIIVLTQDARESAPIVVASSRGPGSPRTNSARSEKAERAKLSRRHKKWQKSHGLAALPSIEELGYDEESMEVVDIAQ